MNEVYNLYAVDCEGYGKQRAGGLALLWKKDVDLTISRASLNHIDFAAVFPEIDGAVFITCLYGYPQGALKYQTWSLLTSVAKDIDKPWMVIGDINQVLGPEDKTGGNPVDLLEIDTARICLEVCNLKEIEWCGSRFTWSNRRKHPDSIEEHLDRAFSNNAWSKVWNYSMVSHLPRYSSDHCPIILDSSMRTNGDVRRKKKKRLYRFEQYWLQNDDCETVVQHSWIPGREVTDNIKHVGEALRDWSESTFGNLSKRIAQLNKRTANLQSGQEWNGQYVWVHELFTVTGAWNKELLYCIFSSHEAEAILQIPRIQSNRDDAQIWNLGLVLDLLYAIWSRRNRWVHDQMMQDFAGTLRYADSLVVQDLTKQQNIFMEKQIS
ncbi:hypothetical protein RIF29_28967 [Crotalaria pallida]|uniref:Endonuclease/exonuclease/phosphatase domain-containing protein n=1 Tax=Crotalaria pallida TaxID=3830 RepID=A0AAN9EDR2_CROPI